MCHVVSLVYMPLISLSLYTVPFAFVVLKESDGLDQAAVVKQLKDLVATKIAKYAVPDDFLVRIVVRFKLYQLMFGVMT